MYSLYLYKYKIMQINDFLGKSFNRWKIIEKGSIKKCKYATLYYPLCQCECGVIREVELQSLKRNLSKSCGCWNSEKSSKFHKTHGYSMISKTEKNPDYAIWLKIKSRCLNKNDNSYHHYGGRGIKICSSWEESFVNFLKDMGWRPEPKQDYSIERVDVNGNYEPSNCKWILKSLQNKNTRNTKLIEFQGKKQVLSDWCKELNLSYHIIRNRVNNLHIDFSEAIKHPKNAKLKKKYAK